jgi:hypothetical protein
VFVHRVLVGTVLALVATALAAPDPLARRAEAAVEVSVETGVLLVRSDGSDPNVVDIRYKGGLYEVWDATPGLTAGAGCLVTGLGRAICTGQLGSATIRGSDGDDVIDLSGVPVPVEGDGGMGDDALNGGARQNTLTGGPGVDGLIGSVDDDRLDGGDGDDLLMGRDGKDVEFGGAGDDILQGGAGSGDTLAGNAGADLLQGGPGDDFLQGDSGGDVLAGGSGEDSLSPGSGDDTVVTGGGGGDTIQCPVRLDESNGTAAPCTEVAPGRAPDSWPPEGDGRPNAGAAGLSSSAFPFRPGRARYVKVKISASRQRTVRVCVVPQTYQLHSLRSYTARVATRYWTKVRRPRPPLLAFNTDVRRGRC